MLPQTNDRRSSEGIDEEGDLFVDGSPTTNLEGFPVVVRRRYWKGQGGGLTVPLRHGPLPPPVLIPPLPLESRQCQWDPL